MGLFDKKYCGICGEQIKLLGGRKVDDGEICKDCASKLSPYFSDRKRSTLADIKGQLAYREANKEKLKSFMPNITFEGDGRKVFVDEKMGKFVICSTTRYRETNADLIDINGVADVQLDIQESETEKKAKDAEGKLVATGEYEYSYTFKMTFLVRHPYFDTISYELTKFSERPQTPYDDAFGYNLDLGASIIKYFTGKDYDIDVRKFRYKGEEGEPEVVVVVAGNDYHGQPNDYDRPYYGNNSTVVPTPTPQPTVNHTPKNNGIDHNLIKQWTCPDCGNVNNGNFCSKCGKSKPVEKKFCPSCGKALEDRMANFCPHCGKSLN